MRSAVLLLIALALPAAAQAQIFKCTDGGRLVYRDNPCNGGGGKVDVRPATGPADDDALGAQYRSLAARGKVAVGMPAALAKRAWGAPDKVNRSIRQGGTSEQWIYYRDARRIAAQYVYVENGVVASIQD